MIEKGFALYVFTHMKLALRFFARSITMLKETGRNGFQYQTIKALERRVPGCIVLLNDPQSFQGIPDLIMIYKDRYFMLETKRSSGAGRRPNQEYYVDLFNDWSYARFVYPENLEEVLDDICEALGL